MYATSNFNTQRQPTPAAISSDIVYLASFGTVAKPITAAPMQITDPKVITSLQVLPGHLEMANGATNLTAGIRLARSILVKLPKSLLRKLVIIGDGEANTEVAALPSEIAALKHDWITARCVDVGNGTGRATLQAIADGTVNGKYAEAITFAQLVEFLQTRSPRHRYAQQRTAATCILVDVSPSMGAMLPDGSMTRILAAQRAAAQWLSVQATFYRGHE